MSEFKKVDSCQFQPRKCALCGAADPPFADTEVDIAPYGHLYICMGTDRRGGCVGELGRLQGLVPAKALAKAVADRDHYLAQLMESEEQKIKVVPLEEVREGMLAGMMAKEE